MYDFVQSATSHLYTDTVVAVTCKNTEQIAVVGMCVCVM